MAHIAFVTCADLSRYFVSEHNPLLTHDDQIVFDALLAQGHKVTPVIWGTAVQGLKLDLMIVRSPWDYMDSEENRTAFIEWLHDVHEAGITLANPYAVMRWSLDKHYLKDLKEAGVAIVDTIFLEPDDPVHKIDEAFAVHGAIVVKPCISAAAKDTHLIQSGDELALFQKHFAAMRGDRAFMIQPFIAGIQSEGEWSLVFLNDVYSHAVHKLPKKGGWLVQDELGGSVRCDEPDERIVAFAKDAYSKLRRGALLYARVDVMPGLMIGELELVEPELFFLDRKSGRPNERAILHFVDGVERILAEKKQA